MDFENDAQEAAHKRVGELMQELYGEEARPEPAAPNFVLQRGSADVNVTVAAFGEKAVVAVWSWVATGVETSADLMRFLLTENANFIFGGFALSDDTVVYQHTIVGETIDKQQLRTSVKAVTGVADDYDERITSRFGGKTAKQARAGQGA